MVLLKSNWSDYRRHPCGVMNHTVYLSILKCGKTVWETCALGIVFSGDGSYYNMT